MNKKLIFLVALIFSASSASCATSNSASTQKNQAFSGTTIQQLPDSVSIHQLDNGIKVLLIENPALPMVGVNTVVKIGSAYESFSSSGMSHMLEHLLFNGTSTMEQRELYDLTDKIGGYNNANTSQYYTNYMMVTPAEHIKQGMEIQSAMLFDSILPEKNFQKEKGIVLEEIAKSLARSREQANRNVQAILYQGHALSLPVLGTYATIKSMDRDSVYEFYKNNYVPNNMLLSVIGNFKTPEMLKLLDETYGKAKPSNITRPNTEELATGFQALKAVPDEAVNHRFYKGKNTLLQQFYTVDNYADDFYSLLAISLGKHKKQLKKQLDEQFPEQIKSISFQIKTTPVKSFLQADIALNDEQNIAAISNYFQQALKSLDLKLTNDAVNAEAIKSKTSFLRQIEKPHMFGIYNADSIAQNGLDSIIESFSGEGIITAGKVLKSFKISGQPLQIIQHAATTKTATENSPITIKLFKNSKQHATVIAKQNSASNLLAIHYMYQYKSRYQSGYGKEVARKWHEAFGNRMKNTENLKKSADYGLSFVVNDNAFFPMDDIYLSPTFGYIRVEGLATDIDSVIQYLNDQMLNFVPSEEEFNAVNKDAMDTMMMGGKNKTRELYKKAYDSLLKQPLAESSDIKTLDYSRFLEFGKNYFAPSNIIISVVSKVEPETINQYFSEFKSEITAKYKGLAVERGFKLQDAEQKYQQQAGGEQSYTFFGFVKQFEKSDSAALTVLSLILQDDIVFNIREKQGLAYRIAAGISKINDKALFYVRVPTLPANVEKLVPQFPGLFNPKFANSISEEDLQKTINMYLGKMMFRRLSSINQAYYLAHSYYFDGDIEADNKNLEALKNATLADVKRVAKKYLQIENPVEIVIH